MSSETSRPKRLLGSIGARLTLWGAGITLSSCLLLCVVLYVGLFVSLRHEIDTFLEGEVHEFMSAVNVHPNDDAGLEQEIRRELGSRLRGDLAFRLIDEECRLIVSSEADDPVAKMWAPPDDWSDAIPRPRFETLRPTGEPHAFRVCSLRVTTADGRKCTAQASYMLDRMNASLAVFRRVCAVALILAAVLALVSGRILANRSLRPVQTITQAADRIGANSLSERIPLVGTGDEMDRLAATVNRMLARIERHVRQMQRFTADASHELRSPLAALRGSAEVALTKRRSVEELRQVLEESIDHYDRLGRIAEDLLLLARADAGDEIVRREPVELDQAVRAVVNLYAPLAQERHVDLTLDPCGPVLVEADNARLRQLVGNLIDNAIKFAEPGDRVTVSMASADGVASITVADTGRGIPAEHLPRILDRFYRADPARSGKRGGAGLGLAICRAIAEAHGGRIAIESPAGLGTIATVHLPIEVKPAGVSFGHAQ